MKTPTEHSGLVETLIQRLGESYPFPDRAADAERLCVPGSRTESTPFHSGRPSASASRPTSSWRAATSTCG
jgi:hypothetical protein